MNLQIETIEVGGGGSMDVIRDIEAVRRLIDAGNHLASRLRLWSVNGEMMCQGDADALKEWDALSGKTPHDPQ